MEVPSEIQSRYKERRKQDLAVCQASFVNGDFKILEKVGHQLKGNGVTFGHPELSRIGEKLECAAAIKNTIDIKMALTEFSGWVSTTFN